MPAPLVLLHGVGLDAAMWRPQVAGLAGELPVITPTLAGFTGDGERFESVESSALQLDAELQRAGVESAHLCGLSLGGMVAISLTALRPQRVRSLIVSGTVDRAPPAMVMLTSALLRLLPERVVLSGSNLPAEADEELHAAEARLSRRLGKGGIRDLMQAAGRADLRTALPAISCPTLVMCGDGDNRLNRSAARRIAAAVPGARLEMVRGAGHVWNLQMPERFNAEVLAFVRSVESGGTALSATASGGTASRGM